jgi:hypothetical protein
VFQYPYVLDDQDAVTRPSKASVQLSINSEAYLRASFDAKKNKGTIKGLHDWKRQSEENGMQESKTPYSISQIERKTIGLGNRITLMIILMMIELILLKFQN